MNKIVPLFLILDGLFSKLGSIMHMQFIHLTFEHIFSKNKPPCLPTSTCGSGSGWSRLRLGEGAKASIVPKGQETISEWLLPFLF